MARRFYLFPVRQERCMRLRPHIVFALALFALPGGPAVANDIKAVLELFTSQGCSSCPRADKLLAELANDERLIPLTLAVDYWDYLGWRDTLALNAHTLRQKAYANTRGDRQVYTPQAVINGTKEVNGNDRYAIEHHVGKVTAAQTLPIRVALTRVGPHISVEIGSGNGPPATVWVLPVISKSPVAIERGENRGKTITYHNVVRGWTRVGDWKGSPIRLSLAVSDLAQSGADTAAVLIQSGTADAPGLIRGGALIAFQK
jgi:hypothetical protein